MEIIVRRYSPSYAEVTVTSGGTKIELGMLNADERLALARKLEEAVDDLVQGLAREEEAT